MPRPVLPAELPHAVSDAIAVRCHGHQPSQSQATAAVASEAPPRVLGVKVEEGPSTVQLAPSIEFGPDGAWYIVARCPA